MTDLTFTLISIFVDFFVEISVKWDQWCEYILKECKISPTTFWNFRFRCGILMKIFLLFTENQWVLPVSFPLLVCTLTVPLRGFPVYIFYFPQKQTNKQTQHSNLNDFTLTGARSQEKQTQISHPSTLKILTTSVPHDVKRKSS